MAILPLGLGHSFSSTANHDGIENKKGRSPMSKGPITLLRVSVSLPSGYRLVTYTTYKDKRSRRHSLLLSHSHGRRDRLQTAFRMFGYDM